MRTIQQVAAFVTMLLQGPPKEIMNAGDDPGKIRQAFSLQRPFYVEVGGLDFTPDLVNFWCDSLVYLDAGRVPPPEILASHGFPGLFAHWFWTTIQSMGEDDYVATPPHHYTEDVVKHIGTYNVDEGWLIAFILPHIHYQYGKMMHSRAQIAKTLKTDPVNRPVFPFLGTLYHNNDQE
jgi:hypothetical protein